MYTFDRHKIYISTFLFFLAIFFVLTNSDSTSPWINARWCLDSGIFQYMGYIVTQGKIPYTDFFDHKGLVLYFINALGILISKQWGVLFLQIVNMTLLLGVWYYGLITIKNKIIRLSIIPISLICLYPYYSYGNLTEEWSLLFISYPIMRYIRNVEIGRSHFTNKELFTIGLCVGIITMIRMNNVAPLLGILICCALIAVRNKEYAYLSRSFSLIFLGWLVPIVICMMYMLFFGGLQGLKDMLFANLLFNIEYNQNHGAPPYDIEYVKFIYKTLLPIPFVLLFCYKKSSYLFPLLIGYFITLITIGKVHHYHYLIVFLPLIVFAIGIVKDKFRLLLMLCLIILNAKTLYSQFSIEHFYLPTENTSVKIGKLIKDLPKEERNCIWSYNGAFLLKEYIRNDFIQCNRMFLSWQIDVSENLKTTECNKITKEHPKYIILAKYKEEWMINSSRNCGEEKDRNFILKNYNVISSVFFNDGTQVYCYKLKNPK